MPALFPTDLLAKLISGPVSRAEVCKLLGVAGSVSMALSRYARQMTPPYLVERHVKGPDISYQLRPTRPGEAAGIVKLAV